MRQPQQRDRKAERPGASCRRSSHGLTRTGDRMAELQRLADSAPTTEALQRMQNLAVGRAAPVLQGDFTLDPQAPPAPNIAVADSSAGRGELWRRSNAVNGQYTVNELPQLLLSANNWQALVTAGELDAFFASGSLRGEIDDQVARQAYLHRDAQAVLPLNVTVHERMPAEHLAASNSEADDESRRRFLADPNQGNIGRVRIFSWLIGVRASDLRANARQAARAGAIRASIYRGNEQLNVRMAVSNRSTEVERRAFGSRGEARVNGATDIIDVENSNRCSGVVTERVGGSGATTLTGSWDTRNNAFELYHFEAGGLPASDQLAVLSKRIAFRSAGPGQRAQPDQANMRLPVAGLLALI